MRVLLERLLHLKVGEFVTAFVPVHKAVTANGIVGEDRGAERNVGLHRAAGSDAQDGERPVFFLWLAGREVNVGERVQLGHHDVDVVGADAC